MKLVVWLGIWLLQRESLTLEERTLFTSALLNRLNALPAHDIITFDPKINVLTVNKVPVEPDLARVLRQEAKTILASSTWKLVREQVSFAAVVQGIHKGISPESVMFSKTALWNLQQLDELYQILAQERPSAFNEE